MTNIIFGNKNTKSRKENDEMCEENNHEWVFQEKQLQATTSYYGDGYKAHFTRRDCFYCKKCLEETYKEKKQTVILPFGGIHHVLSYAPIWYKK